MVQDLLEAWQPLRRSTGALVRQALLSHHHAKGKRKQENLSLSSEWKS
jgi:hypothetical protein